MSKKTNDIWGFGEAIRKIKKAVTAEIKAAIKKGDYWTPLRKFIIWEEQIGAMKCGCRKPAVYVTYCTGIAGRVVLCEGCYSRHPKRVKI